MGLLDAFKQYLADAGPGGLLNPEIPKGAPTEVAKGLLGFAPGIGDAISGYDAIQSARQGNYGEAALNGVGLLPFVPAMGGMAKLVKDGKGYSFLSKDGTQVSFPQSSKGVYEAHITGPDGAKSVFGDGLEGVATVKQWLADRFDDAPKSYGYTAPKQSKQATEQMYEMAKSKAHQFAEDATIKRLGTTAGGEAENMYKQNYLMALESFKRQWKLD